MSSPSLPVLQWDPRPYGARCDPDPATGYLGCPLGPNSPFTRTLKARVPDGQGGEKIVQLPRVSAWRPVPDEINRGAFALAIGEAPGVDEVRELRPFVGRSGQELMSGLGAFGLQRAHWSFANSLSCQPPQNEHEQLLLAIEAWNRTEKKRAKEEEGYVPQLYVTPSEACRPRLLNVARQYSSLLLLGGVALKTMLRDWAETRRTKAGKAASPSIMDMRGGPLRLGLGADGRVYRDKGEGFPPVQIDHVWNVLPTVHPAHVLRSRRWRRVFRRDIGRAFRLFTGHVTWSPPVRVVNPSPEKLRAFLFSGRPFAVIDVETLPANDQETMGVLPPGFSEAFAELLQLEGDDDEDPASLDRQWGRKRRKKRDKLTGKRKDKSALDPLRAVLALIGIGDHEVVYQVAIISKETGRRLLTEDEEVKLLEVVYDWLVSPQTMKCGWNCLSSGMPVLLPNGRVRQIDDLVRAQYSGRVLGLVNGQIAAVRVIGWHHVTGPANWLALQTIHDRRRVRGLVVTADHRVLTRRGWVAAGSLLKGEEVFISRAALTPQARAALLGTLLGDASFAFQPARTARSRARGEGEAGVVLVHSNRGLTCEKARLLGLKARRYKWAGGYVRGRHLVWGLRTVGSPEISALVHLVGLPRKRRLRVTTLDQLGPVGLAWWFADDGAARRNGVEIGTHRYPCADVRAAAKWLSARYSAPVVAERHHGAWRLRFRLTAAWRFAVEIAPFLPPAVRYKIQHLARWARLPRYRRLSPFVTLAPQRSVLRDVRSCQPRGGDQWCLTTTSGNFFTPFGLVKNCAYDLPVMKRHLRLKLTRAHNLLVDDMVPRRDGILDHHAYDPEFPHGLKFVASLHTDTPSWGEDHAATEAETDEAWRVYNGSDVANNARLMPIGVQEVARRNQERVVQIDHVKQSLTCDLHEIGLRVDQKMRAALESELVTELQRWTVKAQRAAGKPVTRVEDGGFNPNSNDQVAHVLFEEWGLPVKAYTESGKYSTDDETLIALFTDPAVQEQERKLLRGVRKVRKVVKKLGSVVYPARPFGIGGHVWPDGRLRTGFNAHVARTGRLSSSNPVNFQNVPIVLRRMYVPDPGHVYVFADFDQLELKIVTALAQAQNYRRLFDSGGDPHGTLAEMVWGDLYRKAAGTKKTGPKGRMRDLVKRVCYSGLYKASVPTIHSIIVEAEDENEELVYFDHTLQETEAIYNAWLAFAPEIPRWWDRSLQTWRSKGYVASAIFGRRFESLDSVYGDEEENDIINAPVQSTAADLCDIATLKLREQFPLNYAGLNTGIVLQVHDSLGIECPEDDAERVAAAMTEAMTQRHEQLPGVTFTAEAEIALRWSPWLCPGCGGNVDVGLRRWYPDDEKHKYCDNEGRCERKR